MVFSGILQNVRYHDSRVSHYLREKQLFIRCEVCTLRGVDFVAVYYYREPTGIGGNSVPGEPKVITLIWDRNELFNLIRNAPTMGILIRTDVEHTA
jgi:hypothetical protein